MAQTHPYEPTAQPSDAVVVMFALTARWSEARAAM